MEEEEKKGAFSLLSLLSVCVDLQPSDRKEQINGKKPELHMNRTDLENPGSRSAEAAAARKD